MKKISRIVTIIVLSFFFNLSVVVTQAAVAAPAAPPAIANPVEPLTAATLDTLNPLTIVGSTAKTQLSTPGGIISRVLVFAFPLAGILLFVMLSWAGFEIVSGAANKKSQDAGRQRATAAIVGFLLLFASYWIIQLLEIVFNVAILG